MSDLPLLVDVEAACREQEMSPLAYASMAARRFADHASDEDWLALMTALEQADDPGSAGLRRMLAWSIAKDSPGCDCHGGCKGEES